MRPDMPRQKSGCDVPMWPVLLFILALCVLAFLMSLVIVEAIETLMKPALTQPFGEMNGLLEADV